jgi:hypothetical protein
MYKFKNLELAINFACNMKAGRVMLGDDNRYWVVTAAEAARLEKAGYEYAF